jgi:hypothetical protein
MSKKSLENLNNDKFKMNEEELSSVQGGRAGATTTTSVTGTTGTGDGIENTDTSTTVCEDDPCNGGK